MTSRAPNYANHPGVGLRRRHRTQPTRPGGALACGVAGRVNHAACRDHRRGVGSRREHKNATRLSRSCGASVPGERRHVRAAVRDADRDVLARQEVADVREVRPAPAAVAGDEVAAQAALVVEEPRPFGDGPVGRADDVGGERRRVEVRATTASAARESTASRSSRPSISTIADRPRAAARAALPLVRQERGREEQRARRPAARGG